MGGQLAAAARRGWRRAADIESWITRHVSPRVATWAAAILALAVVVLGFVEGALVAAGADAWGYASQADLWLNGTLRLDQPLMRELSARIPPALQAPLAYTASARMDLVPAVGPGLPMIMAVFARLGGREAVFYVVPVLAGAAIAAAYAIGARLGGRWAGLVAAILLAASPAFLFQLTSSPMSDIPATAWWGLALAAVMRGGRRWALAAGAAAAIAMLTRPNLVPLAAVPGLFLLWQRQYGRAALFAAGIVPAAAVIAALNTFWHGSPLASGYGDAGELFSLAHIGPNLARYPRWLVESQTPFILLAFGAWFVGPPEGGPCRRFVLLFSLAVLGCYVAYVPFDAWWFLRFLLPAYPPLLALAAGVVMAVAARLPAGARLVSATLVVALVAWHGFGYARVRGTFYSETEYKYAIAGRYVAEHLPARAILFTMQHSGSVRYYSGRATLRWDVTPVDAFEWAFAEIERHGFAPFALVEDWEDEMWRQRFGAGTVPAVMARPPVATLPLGNIRIYDLRSQ